MPIKINNLKSLWNTEFLTQILLPPIGETVVARHVVPSCSFAVSELSVLYIMLQPHTCFIFTHFLIAVYISCSHKLLQIGYQRPKFISRAYLKLLPRQECLYTGVTAIGLVVTCFGCERICVQYFSEGWSFPALLRVGFGVILLTQSSLVSPVAVGYPTLKNMARMFWGGDQAFTLSAHLLFSWIKWDVWFTIETSHFAQSIGQDLFKARSLLIWGLT